MADLGDEFADGVSANQPVILLRGVNLSIGHVSQSNCHFQSDFQWLPEIGGCPLDVVVNVFLNEIKKGRWHPDMYEVGQEVDVATLFLSLKDSIHDLWDWWLSSSSGVGCSCGAGCRAGDGAGFICVLCLPTKMQIKILNSIKTKYPKLM